jgi:hypothetical protein
VTAYQLGLRGESPRSYPPKSKRRTFMCYPHLIKSMGRMVPARTFWTFHASGRYLPLNPLKEHAPVLENISMIRTQRCPNLALSGTYRQETEDLEKKRGMFLLSLFFLHRKIDGNQIREELKDDSLSTPELGNKDCLLPTKGPQTQPRGSTERRARH